MPDLWVVNASPIIVLAKANALNLLDRKYEQVVVPVEVANEVRRGPMWSSTLQNSDARLSNASAAS